MADEIRIVKHAAAQHNVVSKLKLQAAQLHLN